MIPAGKQQVFERADKRSPPRAPPPRGRALSAPPTIRAIIAASRDGAAGVARPAHVYARYINTVRDKRRFTTRPRDRPRRGARGLRRRRCGLVRVFRHKNRDVSQAVFDIM